MDATEHLMVEKYMFYSDTFHMNRNDDPHVHVHVLVHIHININIHITFDGDFSPNLFKRFLKTSRNFI